MPESNAYLTAAPDGYVWALTHTCPVGGLLSTTATVWRNPAAAVHNLAEHARRNWYVVADPSQGEQPPASDFAAVAIYFGAAAEAQVPDTYYLDRQPINTEPGPPPGDTEYVLVMPHSYLLCMCGNVAEMDGFVPASADGTLLSEDDDQGAPYYACSDCDRVIAVDTGEVVGRVKRPA